MKFFLKEQTSKEGISVRSGKTFSVFRLEEYSLLAKLSEVGEVLDIGGSQKSGYHELLGGVKKITTANIDKSYGCDVVFDVENTFPLTDSSFDTVLALHLFEHVYKYENGFYESFRVLRSGGKLVVAVPFMFHVHGSPDDYHRYTRSFLDRLCREVGFSKVEITELGHGLFSFIYQEICGAIPTKILKELARGMSVGMDKLLLKLSKRYRHLVKKIPLGYFVVAEK